VLLPDFLALLSGPNGERMVIHLEFYLDYSDSLPPKMGRYGGSLICQYDCAVGSWMVLIREGGPAVIPCFGEFVRGNSRIIHPFEVVRLWEISAQPILENESMRHLFALVPGLACDWENLRRVANEICESGDEQELSQLLLMLSLKYNEHQIEELIGKQKMGFAEVQQEGSSLLKGMREKATSEGLAEGLAAGIAKGLEEGKVEGQVDEARRLLRAVLAARFPGVESMSELDRIADVSKLESLLIDHALKASEREQIEQAIRQAAG